MTITLNMAGTKADALLKALASFCRLHGGPHCYQNWSPETLEDYLAWHAEHRTLAWVKVPLVTESGACHALVGTGVAWQTTEATIRAREAANEPQFDWTCDPRGDAVFFADFICCAPGVLECLLSAFHERFPHWARLKWFTFRRGKLVQLNRRHLQMALRVNRHFRKQLATLN